MRESVVSDSSFYIAFLSADEINNTGILIEILRNYEFSLGEVILNEITEKHNSTLEHIGLLNHLTIYWRYDYSALLSIVGDRVFEKGEYECMAMGYHIYKKSGLHSLVLDDNPARRFVENNIPKLYPFLRYSLRFLVNCCCSEKKISSGEVSMILNNVKQAIKKGSRPFNLTERNIHIVRQLLNEVDGCHKLNSIHQ